MRVDKILLVIFALTWFFLCIDSRRSGWDEHAYEQFKNSCKIWFWLDTFHVARTRQNCLRFIRATWAALLVAVSASTIAVLIWGR
ncbi:MAG: hypothetical protein E6J11_21160 [Chloroflexi bacterium]|nr:MAG: hypothetical protein E6J11_21160 [Chloroflexota bacterium]